MSDFQKWWFANAPRPATLDEQVLSEMAWQAAQESLIKQAWEMYGEDFADNLMELTGVRIKPEWPDDEDE